MKTHMEHRELLEETNALLREFMEHKKEEIRRSEESMKLLQAEFRVPDPIQGLSVSRDEVTGVDFQKRMEEVRVSTEEVQKSEVEYRRQVLAELKLQSQLLREIEQRLSQ